MPVKVSTEEGRRMAKQPQTPRIIKSEFTNPPTWWVVTSYIEKAGIDVSTGEPTRYVVARKKYDVTDQMVPILAFERRARKVSK